MRWLLAVIAVLLIIPAQASAQSWYKVGGNDKTYTYIDLQSIKLDGSKARVTTLSTYLHPIGDAKVSASQVIIEYDCAANSFHTIEYTYFSTTRAVLGTEPSETIDKWTTPGDGSIDASMLTFACSRKGGTKVDDPFADGYFGHSD
jgi:hypothetical protein